MFEIAAREVLGNNGGQGRAVAALRLAAARGEEQAGGVAHLAPDRDEPGGRRRIHEAGEGQRAMEEGGGRGEEEAPGKEEGQRGARAEGADSRNGERH